MLSSVHMIGKRRSYSELVEGRRRFLGRLGLVLVMFLVVEICSGLFLASYSVGSASMRPTLERGERLLASPLPLGPRTLFGKLPAPARPARGDLVLVEPPYVERPGFAVAAADAFVRFFTARRLSLVERSSLSGPGIERVIGLPGDTVEMRDFVFRVKPAGGEFFLTEFELSGSRYDILRPGLPEDWGRGFPLSGSMEAVTLGRGEYFVAGDSRGSSSDSRSWGPVGPDRLLAKVLLRYWPPGRLGRP